MPKATAAPEKVVRLDPYKSETEREFAKWGYLEVGCAIGKKIIGVVYEPIKFVLPGGIYTIDFRLETADEYLWVETKGSKRMRNYRDSRSKLRAAASIFYKWRFFEVRKEEGRWIVEEING